MTTKISGTGFDELVVDNLVLSNPLQEQYGGSGSTGVYKMGYATPKSATGTSVDFTIPSWAKRITVMFNNVSGNGTSKHLIQIGTTTPQITGYGGTVFSWTGGSQSANHSTGFAVEGVAPVAADLLNGNMELVKFSGNIWSASGVLGSANSVYSHFVSGTVTLSGVLDILRITTVNGTDLFDAGTINVMWEGFV